MSDGCGEPLETRAKNPEYPCPNAKIKNTHYASKNTISKPSFF